MALQLAVVAVLVRLAGWHYLTATALGVEAAVLHNFLWHQRWTWRDRPAPSRRAAALRLARFHLTNGSISLAGNLALTALFSGVWGLDALVSNLIAIAVCSLVNFAASDVFVFRAGARSRRPGSIACLLAGAALALSSVPSAASPEEPAASALSAWRAYEARLDAGYAAAGAGEFLTHDRDRLAPGWKASVLRGGTSVVRVETPSIDDAKLHHWVGAVFVPGLTVDDVISRLLQNAGHEAESYEDVLASRLLAREGDRLRVFMKLRRASVITVTYNTEHLVEYARLGRTRASARSVATRIAELADAGTAREREKPASADSGFLWRLNAYWRYEAAPGGVIVECESVSLSRPVPVLIRPMAGPVVDRIARESLTRTLLGLRRLLASRPAED